MKILHFFKAKSRIGLVNKPIHQNEFNFGVEYGPEAILNVNFLKNFPNYKLDSFKFSNPEGLERIEPEFTVRLREEIVDILNWKNDPKIRISEDLFVHPETVHPNTRFYNACPGEIRGAIQRASR